VDIVAPDTIDEKILKALQEKINLAQTVLGEETKALFA
jgi:DNA-binding Lrp family transcriptional regulator